MATLKPVSAAGSAGLGATRAELLLRLEDPSLTLVDVLPEVAYQEGHIPGSISLPVTEIGARAAELLPDRDADIVVYCGGHG